MTDQLDRPRPPSAFVKLDDQGEIPVEIRFADEIFVKQMLVPKAGTFIPQHSHTYDHLSMLAVGSVRVWVDDVLIGEFHAPTGISIRAHAKHLFETLQDGTLIYCVHNISRTGVEEIESEHILVEA